ncbi:InaF-motif domain containing protein [Trichuris trichiura]|uniref:InaF-motif domain containing protein n=1 Tax=Trichuris trichiura TaxID=36087 RepID=A0A077Z626_TRITR|nr:InaF-motif domain containing protein [Trichuris trichiura]
MEFAQAASLSQRRLNVKCHFFRILLLWIRFATVIGYICSVCLPAIALSIYYIGFWDPQYKEKVDVFLNFLIFF